MGTLDFEEAQSSTNMLVLIHLDRQTGSRTKEPMDPCAFLVRVARCLQDLFANSFLIFQFSGSWVAFEHQASPRRAEPSCPPWLQFLEDAFGL